MSEKNENSEFEWNIPAENEVGEALTDRTVAMPVTPAVGQGSDSEADAALATTVVPTVAAAGTDSAAREAAAAASTSFISRMPVWAKVTALATAGALVIGGAFAVGAATNGFQPVPVATEEAVVRATPGTLPADAPLRTCSVAELAANANLGTLGAVVTNPATGETLLSIAGETGAPTASTMKLATAAVALNILGADYRFTTKVVDSVTPGTVVLVGGGDPTLSEGGATVYSGAPTMADLAAQALAKYTELNPDDPSITTVVIDVSMFPVADAWHPSWPASERTDGYHAKVVPLMVDGDRQNPSRATSPRSKDPVANAANAFVEALSDAGNLAEDITISYGSATASAVTLGSVQSQPVSTLIGQMIPYSDNTLAEQLIRVASVELGLGGTAASIQQTMVGGLGETGVVANGSTFIDGSGLSEDNSVSPAVIAQLVTGIIDPTKSYSPIIDALPVSGRSGTLSSRFTGDSAIAQGAVHAKTGWIIGAYTLAGYVDAEDGTRLVFSIVTHGDVSDSAKSAIDALVTGFYSCGNNLAAY